MAKQIKAIEKMDQSHLVQCQQVFHKDSLVHHYGDQIYTWVETALKNNALWGAISKDNEVVAVMYMEQQGFFHAYPYLALLGVRADWQGQGVGKLMLVCYEAMARALGYSKITLMVGDFNTRAKKLYETVGFVEIGRVPKVYRDHIDEFIMLKTLN